MIKKAIPGYEGLYEVGDDGEVYSVGRYVMGGPGGNNKKYIRPRTLKKLSDVRARDGFRAGCYVGLYKEGKYKRARVKHLVANAFLGRTDQEVLCRDRDPFNCAASNLVLR